MLLAIDTATRTATIALLDENGVAGEASWRAHENHTTSLMPELEHLMSLAGATIDSLGAIAVATGPGSFTGLRIGMSLAKGLALARGLPLIGISTLDALAQAFAWQPLPVCAVLEVGRKRYAASIYLAQPEGMQLARELKVGTAEDLGAQIDGWLEGPGTGPASRLLVAGEVDSNLRAVLLADVAGRVQLVEGAANLRRAGYLAELSWRRWQLKQVNDLETLAPYYVPTASLPQAV